MTKSRDAHLKSLISVVRLIGLQKDRFDFRSDSYLKQISFIGCWRLQVCVYCHCSSTCFLCSPVVQFRVSKSQRRKYQPNSPSSWQWEIRAISDDKILER